MKDNHAGRGGWVGADCSGYAGRQAGDGISHAARKRTHIRDGDRVRSGSALSRSSVDAEGFSEKLPVAAEVTVSAMVVDAVSEPEVPEIVTVDVPTVAVEPAAKVTTLDPVVGLVPNVAVTPEGSPEAARVTLPANAYIGYGNRICAACSLRNG